MWGTGTHKQRIFFSNFQTFFPVGVPFAQTIVHFAHFQVQAWKSGDLGWGWGCFVCVNTSYPQIIFARDTNRAEQKGRATCGKGLETSCCNLGCLIGEALAQKGLKLFHFQSDGVLMFTV